MYRIYNENNLTFNDELESGNFYDLIYADMIYEDKNVEDWIGFYYGMLKNNGIFIVQTDWHTNYHVRVFFDELHATFVNHLAWKNEWGNHPKNRFHQCWDDILVFCKGNNWKFYPDRIQVDKATKTKGLNPSGRDTKTATAWIDDICLTTTAKERIKKEDGHLIKWQKPLRLFDRIIAPFTDENDWICDPFMGSGSLGEWCVMNNRNYVGKELDKETFELAKNRLENVPHEICVSLGDE